MPLIRSISGLRATLGDELTPSVVCEYALAFSAILPAGDIVIGRDGRRSGEWIEQAVVAALRASGRKAVLIGIAPTPTVQLLTEKSEAIGGIAITASHNPKEWNGLKFINSQGVFLNADENAKLWTALDAKKFNIISEQESPKPVQDLMAADKHIASILNIPIFAKNDLLSQIRKLKLRVAIDAVNASGSVYAPKLLERLGAISMKLFCSNNGDFPHEPEPLPKNLGELANYTKDNNCDFGVAIDPDADRLVLIDEHGNAIGEEKTIALAAKSVLMNSELFGAYEKAIVVNLSSSRYNEAIGLEYGAKIFRSAVGEINVVEKMKETNAIIGGEGSGGVILPECHYGRDSLVGIALIIALIAQSGKKLSELANELPNLSIYKAKQNFTGDLSEIIEILSKKYSTAEITTIDGIKLDLPNNWAHIRKSNTEPIIRVIAEAESEEKAKAFTDEILQVINSR